MMDISIKNEHIIAISYIQILIWCQGYQIDHAKTINRIIMPFLL